MSSPRYILGSFLLLACGARANGTFVTPTSDVPAAADQPTSTDAPSTVDTALGVDAPTTSDVPPPPDLPAPMDVPAPIDTPPATDLGGGCSVGQTIACVCAGGLRGDATCLAGGVVGPCRCDAGAPDVPPPACTYDVLNRCYTEAAAGTVCPCARVPQDPTRPQWRITAFNPTRPAALASALILGVINPPLRTGDFLTGLDLDLTAGVLRFGSLNNATSTRGSLGLGLLDGAFRFHAGDGGGSNPSRYDPTRLTATASGTGFRATSANVTTLLSIRDSFSASVIDLPLCVSEISVASLAPDRGCIGLGTPNGGRFNECTSSWDSSTGGTIRAVLTVSATRAITIAALNQSLCQLLSGTNCDTPMNTWTRQPDGAGCGEPGWVLEAPFAAVAARISR